MEKINWSDLPEEIRSRKIVNWGELPDNIDLSTMPPGTTITPLTGEALARLERDTFATRDLVATRVAEAGLTEEQVLDLLNGLKSGN